MKKSRVFLVFLVMALALLAAGCKIKPKSSPTPTSPTIIRATEPGDGDGDGVEATDDGGGIVIPADVPLPEGLYNLEVNINGTVIQFQIDGGIEALHEFYAAIFPDYGWGPYGAGDNVIGAIGTMSRQNEAGDILTINMQYNPPGDITIVYITINRVSS